MVLKLPSKIKSLFWVRLAMVRLTIARLALVGSVFIGLLSFSSFALAIDLVEAKAALSGVKQQGLVCETTTGYLEAKEGNDQAQQIVDSINSARKTEYQRIAKEHGIEVSKVELLAGKKAVDKTPAGQYVKIDGEWIKK